MVDIKPEVEAPQRGMLKYHWMFLIFINLSKIDDILRCESLSTVISMALRSVPKGKWTALLVCLTWLWINIVSLVLPYLDSQSC